MNIYESFGKMACVVVSYKGLDSKCPTGDVVKDVSSFCRTTDDTSVLKLSTVCSEMWVSL